MAITMHEMVLLKVFIAVIVFVMIYISVFGFGNKKKDDAATPNIPHSPGGAAPKETPPEQE